MTRLTRSQKIQLEEDVKEIANEIVHRTAVKEGTKAACGLLDAIYKNWTSIIDHIINAVMRVWETINDLVMPFIEALAGLGISYDALSA